MRISLLLSLEIVTKKGPLSDGLFFKSLKWKAFICVNKHVILKFFYSLIKHKKKKKLLVNFVLMLLEKL